MEMRRRTRRSMRDLIFFFFSSSCIFRSKRRMSGRKIKCETSLLHRLCLIFVGFFGNASCSCYLQHKAVAAEKVRAAITANKIAIAANKKAPTAATKALVKQTTAQVKTAQKAATAAATKTTALPALVNHRAVLQAKVAQAAKAVEKALVKKPPPENKM